MESRSSQTHLSQPGCCCLLYKRPERLVSLAAKSLSLQACCTVFSPTARAYSAARSTCLPLVSLLAIWVSILVVVNVPEQTTNRTTNSKRLSTNAAPCSRRVLYRWRITPPSSDMYPLPDASIHGD